MCYYFSRKIKTW